MIHVGTVKLVHENGYVTSEWDGGKTTQMYLFPEECSYANRDFNFRISSATVETPKSKFSDLTGYTRILMPLSNTITLFQNGDRKILLPYQQIRFNGNDLVTSIGKTVDFNLMFDEGFDGKLSLLTKPKTDLLTGAFFEGYCLIRGEANIRMNTKEFRMNEKDSLFLTGIGKQRLDIISKGDFRMIHVTLTKR